LVKPRVWFDILTPKQVLFFAPVIADLVSQGSEVLATSRKYREIEPAAKMCGLDLKFVGERGGKDPSEQLLASTRRESEVIPIVKEFAPDVALSVASAVCARVAFGLSVPHIAVNDSPHSEVAARLSLPLSVILLCPWIIPYDAWTRYGLTRSQVLRYHALDPVAWLRRKPLNGPVPRLSAGKKTITLRLEESYAPYMTGFNEGWGGFVLSSIGEAFPDHNLVALCRYGNQLEKVREKFGSQYIVPEDFVDGRRLLSSTDLFVGMGGTMSAEAALMGVPTISAFQGSLLTEKYLISVGLLSKASTPSSLLKYARRLLDPSFKAASSRRAKHVISHMEDPVPKIVSSVLTTGAQA
jgi:predicted glycosyltransferase